MSSRRYEGSVMAITLLALAPAAHAQSPEVPPPPERPSATRSPAPAGAPTLAERLIALHREQRELQAEIESLKALVDTADDGGGPLLQRIAEFEQRLAVVEAALVKLRRETLLQTPPTPTGPRGPADPAGLAPVDLFGETGQVTAGRDFNPAISVIPDGVYSNDDRDGRAGDITARAAGFGAAGEEGHGDAHGGVPRGFSLREAELAFSGSVDPYFDVWAIFAVADGEIEVEETYVQTRRFIPGLQLRFGKFWSGVGYINRQHPHQWDFVDQALPHELLFGGTLDDVGVQLTWLPSLPFYAQIGVEALQGDNERLSAQLAAGDDTPFFRSRAGPRLFTGFLKVSPDVGYSSTLQAGIFAGHSRNHQEFHHHDDDGVFEEALEGTSTFFGTDWVYRYDSGKQYGKGDLTLQAEYLYRIKRLDVVGAAGEPTSSGLASRFEQDGLYAQAVYGFAARWTAGLRFDVAGLTNRIEGDGEAARFDSSRRLSANLTFNPTEFSRLRAQWTRGDFAVGGSRERFHQVYVQFQMSLGAHGAHQF